MSVRFSIHALLAESDRVAFFFDVSFFLSTLSLRRATPMPCTKLITRFFLSTLSLRRATRCRPLCVAQYDFSIHALLAESDPCIPTGHSGALHFLSTLSLRRATQRTRSAARATFIFLSTLSLRRATSLLCFMIHPL